jgi:hypothetical protein
MTRIRSSSLGVTEEAVVVVTTSAKAVVLSKGVETKPPS